MSGRPHTIEIWFVRRGATLYLLSDGGGRADWVRNLRQQPRVTVRIGHRDRPALAVRARVLEPGSPEDQEARRLVYDKYRVGYGGDLTRWRDTALPVAVNLDDRQVG